MARADDREILRLAVPAFLALVAEPLFLLADSAIVGHLGTAPLAALGVAGAIVQTVVGLCVFLAYGTTASVARQIGAGDVRGALHRGIDGLWLAVVIGMVVTAATATLAGPLVRLFGAGRDVADPATTYLRIASFGITPLLLMLAATGVLRGLQDTRTPMVVAITGNLLNIALNLALVNGAGWGIAGSAAGSLIAQCLTAVALLVVVVRGVLREGARLSPDIAGIRQAAHAGVALVVRTLALRAALLVTTYAVTRLHPAGSRQQSVDLATHQLAFTLWTLLAFVLEAIEIAAQVIVGRSLGAGDPAAVGGATRRMIRWGVGVGASSGLLLIAVGPLIGLLFTDDSAVRHALFPVIVVIGLGEALCGVAFVLDGVLVGAGDTRYLAASMTVAVAIYAAALLVLLQVPGANLVALWAVFAVFLIGARAVALLRRIRTDAWLVTRTARTGTVDA
jgi:putative MATE family efflux protein